MKHTIKNIGTAALAVFALGLTACGKDFKSSSSPSASGNSAESIDAAQAEMAKAEAASKSAQVAMTNAQTALLGLQDANGNIQLNLFQSGGTSLLNGLTTKLRAAFDKMFAQASAVKAQFAQARGSLAAVAATLNAADPNQAAMLSQIQAQMAQIDRLEAQFSTQMHKVAAKLDLAITAIDKIVSGATSFIPGFGWLVGMVLDYYVMSDLRTLVMELKVKLMAL